MWVRFDWDVNKKDENNIKKIMENIIPICKFGKYIEDNEFIIEQLLYLIRIELFIENHSLLSKLIPININSNMDALINEYNEKYQKNIENANLKRYLLKLYPDSYLNNYIFNIKITYKGTCGGCAYQSLSQDKHCLEGGCLL